MFKATEIPALFQCNLTLNIKEVQLRRLYAYMMINLESGAE